MLDAISARRPSPRRRESTLVSRISPTARISADVSTSVTMMTMNIDSVAAMLKIGHPKWKISGSAITGPSDTREKSVMPSAQAMPVPITMASRIERREIVALPILLNSSTIRSVSPARPILPMLPKSGALLFPPIAQRAATGINVRPMVVITMPVTSGGKKRVTRENIGVMRKPIRDAAITAPSTT